MSEIYENRPTPQAIPPSPAAFPWGQHFTPTPQSPRYLSVPDDWRPGFLPFCAVGFEEDGYTFSGHHYRLTLDGAQHVDDASEVYFRNHMGFLEHTEAGDGEDDVEVPNDAEIILDCMEAARRTDARDAQNAFHARFTPEAAEAESRLYDSDSRHPPPRYLRVRDPNMIDGSRESERRNFPTLYVTFNEDDQRWTEIGWDNAGHNTMWPKYRRPDVHTYVGYPWDENLWTRVDDDEFELIRPGHHHFKIADIHPMSTSRNTGPTSPTEGEPTMASTEDTTPWPQSDYFRSWLSSMEQKIGAKIYPNRNLGTPFIEIPEEFDFDCARMSVDDVLLTGKFMHMPASAQPAATPATSVMSESWNGYYYAKRYKDGILLFVDPDSVGFVSNDADNRPADPLVPILASLEEMFESWVPPGPYDALYESLEGAKAQRIDSLKHNLRGHSQRLQQLNESIQVEMKSVAETNQRILTMESLDKRAMEKSFKEYEGILEANGSMTMSRNWIIYKIPEFELFDPDTDSHVELGPLNIKLNIEDYSIKVTADRNLSIEDNPHPHVSRGGSVCWGGGENGGLVMYEKIAAGMNPFELLFFAANFFKTVYTPWDAHHTLKNWSGIDSGWFCDFCDESHGENQGCPNYCGNCDESVVLDYHETCGTHGCWNNDDEDECPSCGAIRRTEERRVQEERAAEAEAEAAEAETARMEAEAAEAEARVMAGEESGSNAMHDAVRALGAAE